MSAEGSKTLNRMKKGWHQVEPTNRTPAQEGPVPGDMEIAILNQLVLDSDSIHQVGSKFG